MGWGACDPYFVHVMPQDAYNIAIFTHHLQPLIIPPIMHDKFPEPELPERRFPQDALFRNLWDRFCRFDTEELTWRDGIDRIYLIMVPELHLFMTAVISFDERRQIEGRGNEGEVGGFLRQGKRIQVNLEVILKGHDAAPGISVSPELDQFPRSNILDKIQRRLNHIEAHEWR
jgi:hypothetical protein